MANKRSTKSKTTSFRMTNKAKGSAKGPKKGPKGAGRGCWLSCCLLWLIGGGVVGVLAVIALGGGLAWMWPELTARVPADLRQAVARAGQMHLLAALGLSVAQAACGIVAWTGRRWGVIGLMLVLVGEAALAGWNGEFWTLAACAVTGGLLMAFVGPAWAKMR